MKIVLQDAVKMGYHQQTKKFSQNEVTGSSQTNRKQSENTAAGS